MRYVLAALCAVVAIFMGGCAVIAIMAPPLPLIPAGIAILNVLILAGLFGWKKQWPPAFYILGIADLLLAAGATWVAIGAGANDAPVIWLAALVFAVKGVLTLLYAKSGVAT